MQQLAFLEFKLYTKLLNKLRIRGMNAVFGLQVQYTVGDTIIIGLAVSAGWVWLSDAIGLAVSAEWVWLSDVIGLAVSVGVGVAK